MHVQSMNTSLAKQTTSLVHEDQDKQVNKDFDNVGEEGWQCFPCPSALFFSAYVIILFLY